MDQSIKAAVRERIGLGYTKEEIMKELSGAGYPAAESEELYALVMNEATAKPFDPDQMPTVVQEDIVVDREESEESAESPTATAPARQIPQTVKLLLIVAAVLLGAGGVYGFVSVFVSSAPYATEAEMIEGVLDNTRKLTAHGFNMNYHVAVEERSEVTPVFNENVLAEEERSDFIEGLDMLVQTNALPAEVDARVDMAGLLDLRDKERPEFDISTNINVLAEPLIVNVAGSVRMADSVLYGKIDDIPANFAPFIGAMPTGQWIILADESDMTMPTDVSLPISSPQVLNIVPLQVRELLVTEMKRLTILPLQYAQQSRSYLSAQAAQVGMPLLEVVQGEEEQKILERSVELLKKYPPFKFVDSPKKVELDGETVYEYMVDIDFDNLRSYLLEMSKATESITGETLPVELTEGEEFFAENKALFAEFNRLTDIKYNFRADGSLAGMSFDSVFTFNHSEFKQQFRLEAGLTTTRQNDALNITAPEDVYEKTLSEIMDEKMSSYISAPEISLVPVPSSDSSISGLDSRRLGELRFTAELWYNQNGFSYSGMCDGQQISAALNSAAQAMGARWAQVGDTSDAFTVTCNDSDQAYAIIAPLEFGSPIAWCIDSTGFAGEVSSEALQSSGRDYTCE